MKIENLGMLLQETNRSKAYLQKLIKNKLIPNFVLLLQKPDKKEAFNINSNNINTDYYNPNISETKSLGESKIPHKIIQAASCNELQVVNELKKRQEEYFIFSGSGILKQVFEAKKKIIHVHPGKLPEYRGSTCPYYCILNERKWYCTAFIMKPGIDEGEIITSKEFPLPKEVDATRIYDPHTRSETLVDVVKQLSETGTLKTYPQDFSKGIDHYIIHPVLEFIAKYKFKNKL